MVKLWGEIKSIVVVVVVGVRSNSYLRSRHILSVHVFLVARSKSSTNVVSMPGREGELSQATPAVLRNVRFPSKLKTKGNMTSTVNTRI